MPGVTIAIPLSHARADWIERLRVCLESIERQTMPHHMIDTVVGFVRDTTRDRDSFILLGKLLALISEYDATIVTGSHELGEWAPSLTRNIPARWSRRECVTFVDIDAVLHPEYCESAYETLAGSDNRAVTVKTKMTRYPFDSKVYAKALRSAEAFEAMVRNADGNIAPGTGCGTMTTTRLFERVGGLDERFIGYGPTDWDFTERLKRLGVEIVDLTETEGLMLAHQHHPRDVQDAPRDSTPSKKRNTKLMQESMKAKEYVRNGAGWGGLPWPNRF